METIRQCWAHSKQGQRCEHPAGHPGNHVVSAEWSDDECAIPTVIPVAPSVTPPPAPTLVEAPTKCIACGHQHKSGPCKCGCHEFIG